MTRTSLPVLTPIQRKMIQKFQCPGCMKGSNVKCGAFELETNAGCGEPMFRCKSHYAGTSLMGAGLGVIKIVLGLPKGFNRVGQLKQTDTGPVVRLWPEGSHMGWNELNVPVWAMVQDGYLFVRTYSPRSNYSMVDVIENGTLDLCPNAIDVEKFYDDID